MILAYLILAHLLGDFVLQPTKLVLWKMKSVKGVAVHCLIHFIVGTLLLLPFILNGYIWLIGITLMISLIHFFIDQAKISYDLKHDEKVKPFVIDQMLHLLAIMVIDFFLDQTRFTLAETSFNLIYTDIKLINFLSFAVFVTSVIEIYNFQKKREKIKKARLQFNKIEMLKRTIILTLVYGLFTVLSVYSQRFL